MKAGLEDPTAMVLATVDDQGGPGSASCCSKECLMAVLCFTPTHGSDKAEAIAGNPLVSLLFPWNELDRQVIVSGRAEKMSLAESASYFATRPRESQIAAWASRQSRPVSARAMLEKQVQALKEKFGNGDIPAPDFWGGYRVRPERIEFWQGGEHRLHDRFLYTKDKDEGLGPSSNCSPDSRLSCPHWHIHLLQQWNLI